MSFDRGADEGGASVITVFTDAAGVYRLPADATRPTSSATIVVNLLGYNPVSAPAGNAADLPAGDFALEPSANIAAQVPASAWLAQAPQSDAKHLTVLMCTACHQLPTPKIKHYATALAAVADGEDLAERQRKQWRRVVRREGWREIRRGASG